MVCHEADSDDDLFPAFSTLRIAVMDYAEVEGWINLGLHWLIHGYAFGTSVVDGFGNN